MDVSVEQPVNIDDRSMSDVEDNIPVTDYEAMANKIMPELGQEVEDFKYSTWHVSNWRGLEKRITGPEFEAGGWKWRILLFPFGNNNHDSVSIYLDFSDPKGAPLGWHSCVQFALVLWNPEDATQYIVHHAHHRFTAEESDWGFTRFYDLRKLFVPSDNRTRALIDNDSTNITAFVRVLKDPTGVLWHNFIKYITSFISIIRNLIRKYSLLLWPSIFLALCLTSSYSYDSKKETGYVGLKNQGATCYMNSLLQSLFCTTFFRKAVYQIPTEEDEPVKSVSLALQRVFYQLQTSDTPVGTTELTKSFGWDSLDSFMQHDVQEFNRVLQDNLEGKMKNTKADGAITKLFVGKMKSYVKCVNVDYESSRVEDYYDIQLNVRGCKTLRDSFKDYVQEETLEGDNKYQAEGYGLQDAKKGVIFESFPPVLHLQLKRFEYDIQKEVNVKINDRQEFPMEIDLDEFLSEDADRSKPHKYLLHGVLVHSGDVHGGHYFALLKPEKDGKWFKFDDDRVTPVIEREVLEDNYGGEPPNASPITAIRPTGRNLKRFTNAYMLVYIRESDIDEILSPVILEDIPTHLQRRLDEEKAKEEQRKKEMEERHLYLPVKVVTAETFKNHQGFDLANFDDRQYPLSEVHIYKILKTDTYGAFKVYIARTFSIPPEQIRFWVLVNRQNKTVRPDAPIPESYENASMEEIHGKMASRQNELKLYMEVADKPINGKTWFPPIEGNNHIMEIKPNMIEEMKLKSTFQQSEIQDGDIIVFQKALTDKEIQEHSLAGRIHNIIQFYESLTLRIVVSFKPKLKDRDPKPEFDLVAEQVAAHLRTDPLKLRFTTAHSTSGTPKNVIKRTTNQTLSEMLQAYLTPSSHLLFYEMLDISIVELETKKFFKVTWLGNTEHKIDIRLQKNAVVNDILEEILKKVTLSSPNARIRLYEVMNHRIQRECIGTEPIEKIQEFMTLYAEEIPQDELLADNNDRTIQVYHFTKEPLRTHGIPFKFVIKHGEVLVDTKRRLLNRLGMSEKDFARVRIAIVPGTSYSKPEYLEDDGLDHVDKTGRAGRVGGAEKALYIRG
ncbi:7948_t:CDS:10 [Funneliformis caledonium]|uniref:ubiquitinyl hydrolase 1 n=1 Tax=Funneliformis caledonium TaxID=1117310 RepID=A0A9N9BJU3_9GLOM|nr:7948_t:CDS:10 [Funneliformis caledonium]